MARILSAGEKITVKRMGGYRGFLQKVTAKRWNVAPIQWVAMGDAVPAFINAGEWAVKCTDCPEAIIADVGDPIMFCPNCQNIKNGGHVRPVAFPSAALREQLAAVLCRRVNPMTRNWSLGETVADLIAENENNPDGVI